MKRSPLLPIFLIVLVDILGLTIILPLLPFYAENLGASATVVGMLFSSYALCQLIAGPILGRMSDHMGRKPLLIVSQIGTLIGFPDPRLLAHSLAGISLPHHRRIDRRQSFSRTGLYRRRLRRREPREIVRRNRHRLRHWLHGRPGRLRLSVAVRPRLANLRRGIPLRLEHRLHRNAVAQNRAAYPTTPGSVSASSIGRVT